MPTTIYRIQDAEGRGPYKPGFSMRWTDPDADTAARPPYFLEFPDFDFDVLVPGCSGCGFRTMDQLLAWFTPREMAVLSRLGYSIVSMQADTVHAESSRQLIFTRRVPLCRDVLVIPFPQGIPA